MATDSTLSASLDHAKEQHSTTGLGESKHDPPHKKHHAGDQSMSAVEKFTTHTPPASDGSRNDDDSRSNNTAVEANTVDKIDDGSSDLSELDFGDEDEQAEKIHGNTEQELGVPIDDVYANICPAEWSGEIPIFRPSMREFADFQKYMEAINPYGMESGVVLVDPPQEYKDSRPELNERVKSIVNRRPIRQEFVKSGTGFGSYRVNNIEKQRSYNLPQWRGVCDDPTHQPPAPRGQARAGTVSKATRATKSSSKPLPLPPGQKRKPGRPRVHAVKDETPDRSNEIDPTVIAPPTPTSPKLESEPASDHEDQNTDAVATPPAKKRGGRKPKAATRGTPKPKNPNSGTGDKSTSVAARRKHNEGVQVHEIDEKAFEGFDYHIHNQDEYTAERCAELEQKYWRSLMFAEPMYGADMPGSLFVDEEKTWNVANLPNLLDVMEQKIPGVNTAYLYLGMWKASFAWHVEDMDLYSINYLHFGAPKQWYSISQRNAPKFEKVMKELYPQDAKVCDQFLRHKSYVVTPETLEKKGIKVNRMVHREGQFVITYPMGYHSGFNLGYNCAESVNFALESWLPFFEKTQKCQCEPDNVFIDFDWLMRRIRNEPTPDVFYEDIEISDDEDDDVEGGDLPTPPNSVKSQVKAGMKRKRGLLPKEKKKKKIRIAIKKHQPCVLCPNDYAWESLLPTAEGKQAHRSCALYLSETYIIHQDGQDVVFGVDKIGKERSKLRCSFCHITRGACFQCSSQKCTKPYHGTCALLAGVQIDVGEVTFVHDDVEYKDTAIDLRCKLHRSIKSSIREDNPPNQTSNSVAEYASKLKANDIVQFQRTRGDEIFTAVVKSPVDMVDRTLFVQVLPKESNALSLLSIDDLLYVNDTNTCFNAPSTTAIPLPPELLHERFATKAEAGDDDAKKPTAGDTFFDSINGSQKLEWAEFLDLTPEEKNQLCPNKAVDLAQALEKAPGLWHYLGAVSTEAKDSYTADCTRQVADSRANPEIPRPAANRPSLAANFSPSKFSPYVPPSRPQSLIPSTIKSSQAAINAARYHSRPPLPPPPPIGEYSFQRFKADTMASHPARPSVETKPITTSEVPSIQPSCIPDPSLGYRATPVYQPIQPSTPAPPITATNAPETPLIVDTPATHVPDERMERRRKGFQDQYTSKSVKDKPDDSQNYHQCYFVYPNNTECMFIKRKDEHKRHWESAHEDIHTLNKFDGSKVMPVRGPDREQYIALAFGRKWKGPSNAPPPSYGLKTIHFTLPSGTRTELFPKNLFSFPQQKIPDSASHASHIIKTMREDVLFNHVQGVDLRSLVYHAVSLIPGTLKGHREMVKRVVDQEMETQPALWKMPVRRGYGYGGVYADVGVGAGAGEGIRRGWMEDWMGGLTEGQRARIGR